MKPSVLSTSSTLTRSRDAGLDTFDLLRICALWMRAIISPSGSFKAIARPSLPARLQQARDHALRSHVAQRNTTHLELPVVGLRAAGDDAAIVNPRRRRVAWQLGKFQRGREALFHRLGLVVGKRFQPRTPLRILLGQLFSPLVLFNRALLRHQSLLLSASEGPRPSLPEWEVECGQQRARLVVGLRAGADRDVHAPDVGRLVVIDLREDDVLLQPDRIVAAPVEALR